jgi:hypothetical protein
MKSPVADFDKQVHMLLGADEMSDGIRGAKDMTARIRC